MFNFLNNIVRFGYLTNRFKNDGLSIEIISKHTLKRYICKNINDVNIVADVSIFNINTIYMLLYIGSTLGLMIVSIVKKLQETYGENIVESKAIWLMTH
jgi:hypothetical protein